MKNIGNKPQYKLIKDTPYIVFIYVHNFKLILLVLGRCNCKAWISNFQNHIKDKYHEKL